MRIAIDNRIRIPLMGLSDECLKKLQQAFTYANPQYAKLQSMGKRFIARSIPKFINTWTLENGCLTVPRGGASKVKDVIGSFRVLRCMSKGDEDLAGAIPDHCLNLRPYQERLKRVCLENKTALVRSPPGSGKTTIGYSIAAELKLPTLVVVPTERIFQQWVRGVDHNLGMNPKDVGIIKGSKRVIRPLTIGMQQTLRNCARDYTSTFGLVIGDEAQRFAASTFFDVIDVFDAAYRIGVSADERRADRKEFLVYDVFGPVALEIPRSELIEQGAIIDAQIRIVPSEFKAEWYKRMKPKQRLNSGAQDRLLVQMGEDQSRNDLIASLLDRCVDEGQPTITLTWRRDHCLVLNSQCISRCLNSGLLMGGKESQQEFDRAEREMAEGLLNQAVGTYQAVGVGFDLPRVSRGIFATPCASRDGRQQFLQFCGRYERPDIESGKINRDDSVIYYVWDQHVYGNAPVKNIVRWKPKTVVLVNGVWVPGKEYLKANPDSKFVDEEDVSDDVLGVRATR